MTKDEFLKEFPSLIANYQPADGVLKQIKNVTLCMIVGPSGVGKSSLIKLSGFSFVPSDTTRDARPGEQEGIDMYFRKDYEQIIQDIRTGSFVQIAPFATGDLYATKNTSYPESGVGIMPVMADVIPIFRNLSFKSTVTAFITPPNYTEWMRRMGIHGIGGDQFTNRLAEARRSFEFALADDQTHFILNDDLPSAEVQLKNLVAGDVDAEREAQARSITESLPAQLP